MDPPGEVSGQIRTRRAALGLTLDELAGRSGVSRSMLSEIERGVKNPTIKVLFQVAQGLGCTISQLLGEPVTDPATAEVVVVRAGERHVLVDPRSGVARYALSPAFLRRGIEVLKYVIPPGAGTGDFSPQRPGVEEHIVVVRGALACRIGGLPVALATGDSLWFRADVSHGFRNPGDEPCDYIVLIDASRAEAAP